MPALPAISRIAIGLVLMVAGFLKIGDPVTFARDIENFDVLPPGLENIPAILLPWVELTAGLALVLGFQARGAAWVAVGLMAAFTLAVVQALARGLDISCGCFGTASVMKVGGRKLAENLALLIVAIIAARRRPDAPEPVAVTAPPLET